jgi:hypothetical protein
MNELKTLLNRLPLGNITDAADLERLLVASLEGFTGSDGGMEGYKLLGRMEQVHWQPPILSFVIERYGGTVCGSTRAELQHWEVDIDATTAEITETSRRQLETMAMKVDVEPIKAEIVQKILSGDEDPRLRWIEPGVVQAVLSRVFPNGSGYKQTVEGRRRRLRDALAANLECQGWAYQGRNVFYRQIKEEREQPGYVFLADLADRLGLDRVRRDYGCPRKEFLKHFRRAKAAFDEEKRDAEEAARARTGWIETHRRGGQDDKDC